MGSGVLDLRICGGEVFCRPTPSADPRFRPVDLLVKDGQIIDLVPPEQDVGPVRRQYSAEGRLVLPGIINAHTHSYGQLCRHALSNDTLEPWLPIAVAWSRHLSPADCLLTAQLHAADALRFGVTTVLDHARIGAERAEAIVDGYESAGLRVALAPQISDRRLSDALPLPDDELGRRVRREDVWPASDTKSLLQMYRDLAVRIDGSPTVELLVGPSSMERCTPELLGGLARLSSDHRLGIHTHILESPLQRQGCDPLRTLEEAGLLTAKTSLAHAVHLTSDDRQRIAAAGASVVHNPVSNLATGAGWLDLTALRRTGVNVALGSDGFNCGGSQDLAGVMRLGLILTRPARRVEEWLTPADAWLMATEGGARALAMQHRVGSLTPGLAADFLIVDPARAGWFRGPDWLEQFVYGGFGQGLESVFVAGRQLTRDGRLLTLDQARLAKQAEAAFERLTAAAAGDLAVAERLRPPLRELRVKLAHPRSVSVQFQLTETET